MSELQHQTDIEQAKAKLEDVQNTKAARNDPRAGEVTTPAPRKPATDGDKQIKGIGGKKPKKKKFGQRLKEAMFSEDIGSGSVTEYIFFKIFIPSTKRILSDMANSAINMALGLDPKTRTIQANTHTANASVYRDRNYNRQYSREEYTRRDAISELEWDEETANDIAVQMCDLIDRYGNCSIADAYAIMDMGSRIRTTDRNWGWTSPRSIEVVCVDRANDRWIVDVQPARPLN